VTIHLDLYNDHPAPALRVLGWLYGQVVRARNRLYETGWFSTARLPIPVVSIGNLTVGGTGKTPLAITVAAGLRDRGFRAAVLSRGYRGTASGPVNVVSDGRNILMSSREAGDEPVLMAQSLPGVPVLTGRNRAMVGRWAVDRFGVQVVVLDDGFQHLRLFRDVNLLLLDAAKPFGNGHMVPAGPLREPIDAARRAAAFVLTRVPPDGVSGLRERLERAWPGRPVFLAHHRPCALVPLGGGLPQAPSVLAGKSVAAFCGLARPEVFLQTLKNLGADVPVFVPWPDHHDSSAADLADLVKKAKTAGLTEAVTSAKDAVKLQGEKVRLLDGLNTRVLEIRTALDREDEFFEMISKGCHFLPHEPSRA
jgi:tetraacyldisaccharide 4'-kinase